MGMQNRMFTSFDRGRNRMFMSFGRGGRRRRRCRSDLEFVGKSIDQAAQCIDLNLIGVHTLDFFSMSFERCVATELQLLSCLLDVGLL